MGTLIVGACLIAVVAAILANMISDGRKGKPVICGGDCGHCKGACGHCGGCGNGEK